MNVSRKNLASEIRETICRTCGFAGKANVDSAGSQLWNTVEVLKVYPNKNGRLIESDETERLPHRPDAFFALYFPDRDAEDQTQYFFYEADRKTTSVKKMQKKLRAHFQ